MDAKNGHPSSRHKLLKSVKSDKQGEKAREHFYYLWLDSLKKD